MQSARGNSWPIYTFTGVTLAPASNTTLTISLGVGTVFYALRPHAGQFLARAGETHTYDKTYSGVTVLVAPIARFRSLVDTHPIAV